MSYEVQRAVGRAIVGKSGEVSSLMRKSILMNMAIRANDDGSGIYASKLKIAMWLETAERSICRAVATLEKDGLLVDEGEHINPSGAVTRNYRINLDALEKLPRMEEVFVEKRTAERRRKKRGSDKASAPKSAKGSDKASARGSDEASEILDASSAKKTPIVSLPSKEERETNTSGAKAPDQRGFKLTPNARDPDAPKRSTGRRSPKAGEAVATRSFWARLKDSGLLHETAKARCKPNRIDEQLAPILQAYGDELVTKVVGAYYKREKKIEGGARAAGLQTICEDGRLVDWCEDAKRGGGVSSDGVATSAEEARKRVQSGRWREAWGDENAPIYAQARAALGQGRVS